MVRSEKGVLIMGELRHEKGLRGRMSLDTVGIWTEEGSRRRNESR